MKLHFWAPLCTTCAVLPEMQSRQAGRIVNISSIGGKTPSPPYGCLLCQQICAGGVI
ncbi:SDR family NAD(P)-dependent oxidoreductase [Kovacikia minuta]|uniref:SDR family NAD(P)-dependent oxidoreductase n=1 Tax=Kovacikia minuta TaxID=2931930 RepID=UPI0020C747EA|nr:SDR family NAD(P)-dependent oxidoreductase [Kovacikia minuta]